MANLYTRHRDAENFLKRLKVGNKIWVHADQTQLFRNGFSITAKVLVTIDPLETDLIAEIGTNKVTKLTLIYMDPVPANRYVQDLLSINLVDAALWITKTAP